MNKKLLAAAFGAMLIQACGTTTPPSSSAAKAAANAAAPHAVEMNPKVLVENNNLGNCLACHAIAKQPDVAAGNIAPPFVEMKARFPDRAKLRAIIYDEQVNNPDTIMPPFGRNKVLTAEQIDAITDYILQF